MELVYTAHPTIAKFHASDAFYRGIRGPVRSGSSTACSVELYSRAVRQEPWNDIRATRFAIIRNTYRELKDTTLKTWLLWFPEDIYGAFNYGNMAHHIKRSLPDGTQLDAEFLFRALDRPGDVAKLLSMELTAGWVNEAREIPKGIIDTLGDRVGQYPPKFQGGCTWRGVIMDTNSPDDDHWWYGMSERDANVLARLRIDLSTIDWSRWAFFNQPGALLEIDGKFVANPKAENIENLNEGQDYYLTRVSGKSRDYIRVYYCCQYGFLIEGKPIFPEYVDAVHCSQEILEPVPGRTIYVGLDFGLTPAALFAQQLVDGRWQWIDELVTEDMGAVNFAKVLGPMIRGPYKDFEVEIWGDPAGDERAQTDETTVFEILNANHIPAEPAPTNDFTLRREAVANFLNRMVDGKPGFQISPKCKVTRKGLAGGYHYKRMNIAGEERYHEKPNKNRYSHPVEAGEYAMMGAGEHEALIQGPRPTTTEVQPEMIHHIGL